MSKVLVTLDFDGVVSPIDKSRPLSDFERDEDFEVYPLGGFDCAIRKATKGFLWELRILSEEEPERFTVAWASSWNEMTLSFASSSRHELPEFGYVPTNFDKARAIADATLEEDASLVLVFEDHQGVHQKLRNIWKKDERFADRRLISFKPKTAEGITFAQILEARSLIAAELGKDS